MKTPMSMLLNLISVKSPPISLSNLGVVGSTPKALRVFVSRQSVNMAELEAFAFNFSGNNE